MGCLFFAQLCLCLFIQGAQLIAGGDNGSIKLRLFCGGVTGRNGGSLLSLAVNHSLSNGHAGKDGKTSTNFHCLRSLLAQLNDHVFVGHFLANVGLEGGIGISIANQYRGNGGQTGSLDCLQVNLQQQLALFDLVAIVNMNSERLARPGSQSPDPHE